LQGTQTSQRGSLTGSIRTQESKDVTGIDLEGDIFHRSDVTVAFVQSPNPYGWRHTWIPPAAQLAKLNDLYISFQ
jgi:hypothetical protein